MDIYIYIDRLRERERWIDSWIYRYIRRDIFLERHMNIKILR